MAPETSLRSDLIFALDDDDDDDDDESDDDVHRLTLFSSMFVSVSCFFVMMSISQSQ